MEMHKPSALTGKESVLDMDHYYLLGSPIAHSLSPKMMNTSFRLLGVDAEYGLRETTAPTLTEVVTELKKEGACGWNVTMPVKSAMMSLCDELSLASRIGGSVNTVVNRGGRLTGHTTDGIGLVQALARAGISIKGEKLALLGTGGAASAILIQCAIDGAKEIAVFANRPASRARAERIRAELTDVSPCKIEILSYEDPELLRSVIAASRVLINATNVGMEGADAPSCLIPDESFLHKDLFVYDIIYHPAKTPLLAMAEAAGIPFENGVSMLLCQGAASFRLWTGLEMPLDDLVGDLFR